MTFVLDASAILALLQNESGQDAVAEALAEATVSAVNLAEVASKLADHGYGNEAVVDQLGSLGMKVIAFDGTQAYRTGQLRGATRGAGLSLGDRACLGLAQQEGATVLTTDRAWSSVALGVDVRVIR